MAAKHLGWAGRLLINGLLIIGLELAGCRPAEPAGAPPAWRLVSQQVRLFPHAQRYLQHTSLYRTEADALTIWRALARQSGVQPAGGLGLDGPGVTLSKIRDLGLVRYTVGVRIWPAAGRTSVMFQQTLFLLP